MESQETNALLYSNDGVTALRSLLQLQGHVLRLQVFPSAGCSGAPLGQFVLHPEELCVARARATLRHLDQFLSSYKTRPLPRQNHRIDEYLRRPRPGTRVTLSAAKLKPARPHTTVEID